MAQSVDVLLNGAAEDAPEGGQDEGSDHLSSDEDDQPPQSPPRYQPYGAGPGRDRPAAKRAPPKRRVHSKSSEDEQPQPKKRKGKADAAEAAEAPNCMCGKPAVERTVKQATENQGRAFYGCAEYGNAGCKFFLFKDQPNGASKAKKPLHNRVCSLLFYEFSTDNGRRIQPQQAHVSDLRTKGTPFAASVNLLRP